MRNTQDPLAYVFAKPDAKRILYTLAQDGPVAYEAFRQHLEIESQTFYRITRRLAQFALIHLRAPQNVPDNPRIRVEVDLTKTGDRMVPVLKELDQVIRRNRRGLSAGTTASLLV